MPRKKKEKLTELEIDVDDATYLSWQLAAAAKGITVDELLSLAIKEYWDKAVAAGLVSDEEMRAEGVEPTSEG